MSTFLFIHGAWHGGWCWEKVASALCNEGHTVLAPDLPGRDGALAHSTITLSIYVNFLKKLLLNVPHEVIVVSHSFGGIIATQLAHEIPEKISSLIYVCAFLPQHDQSLMDIARAVNHKKQPSSMVVDPSGATISLEPSSLGDLFFNCCTLKDKKHAIARMCPEPFFPMTEKACLQDRRWEQIPKIYVECTKDNALTAEAQHAMYSKYPCEVISLPTDHSPFLSTPKELIQILKTSKGLFPLDNIRMNVVKTAETGVVNHETIFVFSQNQDCVSASYEGGKILLGFLVGKFTAKNRLVFTYCQMQKDGKLDNGVSECELSKNEEGKFILTERFEWKSRPGEFGTNIFQEI